MTSKKILKKLGRFVMKNLNPKCRFCKEQTTEELNCIVMGKEKPTAIVFACNFHLNSFKHNQERLDWMKKEGLISFSGEGGVNEDDE